MTSAVRSRSIVMPGLGSPMMRLLRGCERLEAGTRTAVRGSPCQGSASACGPTHAPRRLRSISFSSPAVSHGTLVRRGGRARLRPKHGVGDDHAGAKLGLDFGVALAPALVHLPGHRFWEDVVLPSLDAGEGRARDFARTRLWPIDASGHVRVNRARVRSVDADAPLAQFTAEAQGQGVRCGL